MRMKHGAIFKELHFVFVSEVMSVSVTYIMYGVCCFLFLLVTVFLFICKIGLIDADPANRKTSTRWVRNNFSQYLNEKFT